MLYSGKILGSIHLERTRHGPNGRARLHIERLDARAFLMAKFGTYTKNG
jgi:uncharacterized protein involved in outer membrane biogenesis